MIQRIFSISLALVMASAPGFAQNSGKATVQPGTAAAAAAASVPVMPKNPTDLMLLASQVNGLSSMEPHPWHIKANFQTFDPDGKPKGKGVFEEWWAGPYKYKLSYVGEGSSGVTYRNGDKEAMTGSLETFGFHLSMMANQYLIRPLPAADAIEKRYYDPVKQKMGTATLECLRPDSMHSPSWSSSPEARGIPTTCFVPGSPIIRLEVSGDLLTIFNDVAQADGHYFARDIWVENGNLPVVNMKVTELEFPPRIEDSEVLAPQSARAIPVPRVGPGVMAGYRVGGKNATYPSIAKSQRIEGMVMLETKISKTGNITDLQLVSGPKVLRQSALDAVKTWKYKPYTLGGQPVEVETSINIIFTFGS
jgi:TonB family protein